MNKDDLSFNLLPEEDRKKIMFNGTIDPYNTIVYDPISFRAMQFNSTTYFNGERILYNPFTYKISAKVLYEEGYQIKKWVVNEDNEWEEKQLK